MSTVRMIIRNRIKALALATATAAALGLWTAPAAADLLAAEAEEQSPKDQNQSGQDAPAEDEAGVTAQSFRLPDSAREILREEVIRRLPEAGRLPIPSKILRSLGAGNLFRLDLADAYLVHEPPAGGGSGGTLQIASELNVLSYGNDWERVEVKPFLFHLRLNSWSGFYWKVNTSRGEVSRVEGTNFGAIGDASEDVISSISVDVVGDKENPTRYFLRFSDAYLIQPALPSQLQIIAAGNVLSYGADWTVTPGDRPWVYTLRQAVWKGFEWRVNTHRLKAYRVRDPLDPCRADTLAAVVSAPAATNPADSYDVFGCTWAAEPRPEGVPYPPTNALADLPDENVVGKATHTATYPRIATRVQLFDAETNAALGAPFVAPYGDFDLRFTSPAATRAVVAEITSADTGEVLHRTEAVTVSTGDSLRHLLTPGEGPGGASIPFPTTANTGVFTRVGFVELADIDTKGFAEFDGSPAQWRDAPFSGGLKLFGAFTQPFYPTTGDGNYCYKIKITPPSGPATYLADPLYKTRYVVRSDGTVGSTSVQVGPTSLGAVDGCYKLTPLSTTPGAGDPPGAIAVFWSFPDLLGNWNTGARNELHTLKLELYTAATGAPVTLFENDNLTAELYLDNTPITLSFDQLDVVGGSTPITGLLGPNSCAIANLTGGGALRADYTASHASGFLAAHQLSARSNSGVTVWSEGDAYAAPSWSGPRPPAFVGRPASAPAFDKSSADFSAGRCAYVFGLAATARTTNGYGHTNHRSMQRFYYIEP